MKKEKKNSARNYVNMHIIFIRITSETEKLLVNDKSTSSCQTYMSPKHYNKRYKQQKLTYKITVRLTSLHRPQFQSVSILSVCQSVCYFNFVFMFLAKLFKCFTQFGGCSPVWILINFMTCAALLARRRTWYTQERLLAQGELRNLARSDDSLRWLFNNQMINCF